MYAVSLSLFIASLLAVSSSAAPSAERRAYQPASFYSSLVVFGASYNDNAHPRPSQYAGTLRQYYPYSNYGGRYCNGPVAVEQMVAAKVLPTDSSGFKLIDYAYGGSHIDNSLTGGSAPATKDQVAQYLNELSKNATLNTGSGRVLHYINSGINPLTAIWNDAVSAGLSSNAQSNALSRVAQNVQAIATQMRSILSSSIVTRRVRGRDFLIVGIPPLEIVPSFAYQHGDSASLQFLKTLSNSFSDQLKAFAVQFAKEVSDGKVYWYDMRSLWYDAYGSPSKYGITASPITKTCYDSTTGSLCSNPSQYLYLDSLHPVTTFQGKWANEMLNVVKSGRTAA